MNFVCQQDALENLKLLAEHKQHGVLIVGDPGSGKTYLTRQYSKMLGITDFYIINPVISDLKTMIDGCVTNGTSVVLCIENLDDGVIQAAYPLLKLIEDCPSYIYVVVTCNNLFSIPNTIPSRCTLVTINPPTRSDITQYAQSKDPTAYDFVSKHKVWSCVKGMSDADIALKFTPEHLKYFDSLPNLLSSKDSVSNISWKLAHYSDNSDAPVVFVLRYLLQILTGHGRKACIECLNDLADNRISKNAIMSKFVFENKYVE
jgi:hypothetical protein